MRLKQLGAALGMILLLVVAAAKPASAATIGLNAVNGNLYQQGVQNPCIFSNPSCQQPAGFTATAIPNNNPSSYDVSVTYSGQTLLNLLNGSSLMLGLDINEASGQGDQTLLLFTMAINGSVVDTYNGSTGNVGADNNGNGYADYLLTNFSSFLGTDTVTFRMVMSVANDGAENVFVIAGNSTPNPTPVPEPATMLLLGTGLLAAARARRRKSA